DGTLVFRAGEHVAIGGHSRRHPFDRLEWCICANDVAATEDTIRKLLNETRKPFNGFGDAAKPSFQKVILAEANIGEHVRMVLEDASQVMRPLRGQKPMRNDQS